MSIQITLLIHATGNSNVNLSIRSFCIILNHFSSWNTDEGSCTSDISQYKWILLRENSSPRLDKSIPSFVNPHHYLHWTSSLLKTVRNSEVLNKKKKYIYTNFTVLTGFFSAGSPWVYHKYERSLHSSLSWKQSVIMQIDNQMAQMFQKQVFAYALWQKKKPLTTLHAHSTHFNWEITNDVCSPSCGPNLRGPIPNISCFS